MASTTGLRKATPVFAVDRIEPALQFWKKVGLLPTTEVPDTHATDGRLAFAILSADGVEIMYQTIANVAVDLLNAASDKEAIPSSPQRTILFFEVDDLTQVENRLSGEPVVMPRRTTFYGSTEMGYGDRAGNVVIFAENHAE